MWRRSSLLVACCLLLAGCGVQLRDPLVMTTITVTATPDATPLSPLLLPPPATPMVGNSAGHHIQRPGWFPDWVLWLTPVDTP